jgi:hypothetical protein
MTQSIFRTLVYTHTRTKYYYVLRTIDQTTYVLVVLYGQTDLVDPIGDLFFILHGRLLHAMRLRPLLLLS